MKIQKREMKTERRGRPKKQVEIATFDSTKVKLLITAIPEPGDKYTTVHAQKGVAGIILPDTDMPFSLVTGQRPE